MHPILSSYRRLALYLAAWLLLGFGLADWLMADAGVRARVAFALGIPLALAYGLVCLSIWYTCRVLPLHGSRVAAALGAQVAAAIVAGTFWAAAAAAGSQLGLPAAAAVALLPLGILLYLLAAAGYYLGLEAENSRQAELLARDAELRALKAQINPHFLFNSLNSISALTGSDPVRARSMCVLLGDFLRRTLKLGEQREVTLAEELELVHAYLAVEQVRFGDRLRVDEAIAAGALAARVPPLLLQPLVENAVVHGVAHLLEGGWIALSAACQPGRLILGVANRFDPDGVRRASTGLGMANVRGRLQARYGASAGMEVARFGDRFSVSMELPMEEE